MGNPTDAEVEAWEAPELGDEPSGLESVESRTTIYPDRASWLAARANHLGASDAPVILGATQWKSPYALFVDRTQGGDAEHEEEPLRFEVARFLEPKVAELYGRETGRTGCMDPGDWCSVVDANRAYLACTPDRFFYDEERGEWGCVELKTAHIMTKSDWDDEPPLAYQIQLQHQLMVTGLEWGSIAALVGHNELKIQDYERNDDFISHVLRPALSEFWQRLIDNNPPDPDGSPSTTEAIAKLYGHEQDEKRVILPLEAIDYDDRLQVIKEEAKVLDAEKKTLQNKIKVLIGDAATGDLPHCQYTFRTIHRKEHRVKASSSRSLRRKAKKG